MIKGIKGTAVIVSAVSAFSALSTGGLAVNVNAEDGIQARFYVSPDGNDSGKGHRLEEVQRQALGGSSGQRL